MIESGSRTFIPVLLFLIHGVVAQQNGSSFECRPNPWNYDERFTITFRIDRSKYPSLCKLGISGLPSFQSAPDNGAFSTNCSVPKDIRNNGSCSFPSGMLGCGCTDSDDNGFYVIEYNFIAHPDYDRRWIADIACTDTNGPAIIPSGDCYIHPVGPNGSLKLQPPENIHDLTEGDDLTVTCSATCDPLCSFLWEDNSGTTVAKNGTLRLVGVTKGSGGQYKCVAANTEGNATRSITVIVQDGSGLCDLEIVGITIGCIVFGIIVGIVTICIIRCCCKEQCENKCPCCKCLCTCLDSCCPCCQKTSVGM